jgi:hypothetical protein
MNGTTSCTIFTKILCFWTLSIILFLFKTRFEDWILSLSSGKTYSAGPIRQSSPYPTISSIRRTVLLTSPFVLVGDESSTMSCHIFSSPVENSITHFATSSLRVCLMVLLNVLLLPRCSCSLRPWFLMPLLHSGLFLTVSPLWLHPLNHESTAQQFIRLWAAANFFQDPPLPWIHFLGYS